MLQPPCPATMPSLTARDLDYGVAFQQVTLYKVPGSALGLAITGGADTPFINEGICIREVLPGG